MDNKYDLKKFGSVLLVFSFLLSLVFYTTIVLATHTSSADLEPEWSPANQNVEYTVEFCKLSGDTVNEVRIYRNYDGSVHYTNFQCYEKPGWELLYIGSYPACFYVANSSSPFYDPLDNDNECAEFRFSAVSPDPQYCDLTWRFETRDDKDYWQYLYDNTSVDDDPPNITKTIEGPHKGTCPPTGQGECWITTETIIIVSITDIGDCGISGLDFCEITYTVDGGPVQLQIHEELNGEISWQYSFSFEEDSVHELNITCFDVAGNKVEDKETFYVDSTPPTTTKIYGEPKYPENIEQSPYPHWISNIAPISFNVVDGGDTCAIGVDKTWFINLLVPDSYCLSEENCEPLCDNPYTCESCYNTWINIEWCQEQCTENWQSMNYSSWENCVEDCVHKCCNGLPQGRDPIWGECHPKTKWCDISCNGDGYYEMWRLYNGTPFTKGEESCHLLQYFSVDELGNIERMNYQCFFVDVTPPVGEKVIEDPKVPCSESENCDYWVKDHETEIILNCTDSEPHPVGQEEVCFRISFDREETSWLTREYCSLYQGNMDDGEDGWCCVGSPLILVFQEDSLHNLEYYCRDALGNRNEVDVEWFKVDSQPPIINKTIVGPQEGNCSPVVDNECWIKDWKNEEGTIIHVEVEDNNTYGCAVNGVECEWWYFVDGEGPYYVEDSIVYKGKSGKITPPFNIKFYNETEHELHINCTDTLGNFIEDKETFYVDSTPPTTTKIYGEPFYSEGSGCGEKEWINSSTPIYLEASDGTDNWPVGSGSSTLMFIPPTPLSAT